MTVFLTILKIIGLVLLGIVGLVVVVLALVLFIPVRYQIGGHIHGKEDMIARGKITWLLHLVNVILEYKDNYAEAYLRILFFRKKLWEFPEPEDEDSSEEAGDWDKDTDTAPEESGGAKSPEKENEEDDEELASILREIDEKKKEEKRTDSSFKGERQKRQRTKKKRFSITEWYHQLVDRIKQTILSVKRTIYNIRKKTRYVVREVSDEKNHAAVLHVKDEILYFLKKINPKKIKMNARFSGGSPDRTGQALGVIALLPQMYKNRWNICPDFESDKFYIDGEADIQGHIRLILVAGMMVRLFVDKNCRRMYHRISQLEK